MTNTNNASLLPVPAAASETKSSVDDSMMIYIDVVDTCNLRCPCCPVGSGHGEKSSRLMSPALFRSIIEKALLDFKGRKITVGLYNWSEPFLHPDLSVLTEHLRDYGIRFTLSTNLALPRLDSLEKVLLSRPYAIGISLSGYSQDVYGLTHRGGRIDVVHRNMLHLSNVRKELGLNASVYIAVKWLDYTSNSSEAASMEKYAKSLGFDFLRENAGYLSWDRLIACLSGRERPYEGSERLINPPVPNSASEKVTKCEQAGRAGPKDGFCYYQERELCIRCDGDVYVCCLLPYRKEFRIGNYLSETLDSLQQTIRIQNVCGECYRLNLYRPLK